MTVSRSQGHTDVVLWLLAPALFLVLAVALIVLLVGGEDE